MYFIKRIREEKKNTCAKPSGEAQFEGMIYGGGLHFVGGEPYTVGDGGGGAGSGAGEEGVRGGGVRRGGGGGTLEWAWGWWGRGGGGGGGCAFECARGGEAGA